MHLVVQHDGLHAEVQVRTAAQQYWAELCERLADFVGLGLKYGSGPAALSDALSRLSEWIQRAETDIATMDELQHEHRELREALQRDSSAPAPAVVPAFERMEILGTRMSEIVDELAERSDQLHRQHADLVANVMAEYHRLGPES